MFRNSEAVFYNALQVALGGAYERLERARAASENWETAWLLEKQRNLFPIEPDTEWKKLAASGITLVLKDDPGYPPLLREIPLPPFGIYVRGTLPDALLPALAIVGTRRATPSGKATARRFASAAATAGMTVVSGLALGIDGAAHEGCLEAGGKTIAVLAHGLDGIYPRAHESLGKRIIERGGALVSEYPLGSPSYPHRFLERNRIVSGLAQGVLLIEAPEASGSLVTARFALEQNRQVFATPGPLGHPNFAGSHGLIRAGAEFVTEPGHILESFGIELPASADPGYRTMAAAETDEERLVLGVLRSAGEAVDVDKIIEASKLEAQTVIRALGFLSMKNAIREAGGGYTLK